VEGKKEQFSEKFLPFSLSSFLIYLFFPLSLLIPHFRGTILNIVNHQHQIVKDNPVNLSILITGGKETNKDA